jgi:putative DNA primase/helicase
MNNLNAALDFANSGTPVFPCRRDNKQPIGVLVPNGHNDATGDPEQVTQWFGENPRAAIGMPTGQITGTLVVDLDMKGGVDGVESWRDLTEGLPVPTTRTVVTPSGGLHHYYSAPPDYVGQCSAGKLGAGIDIRSDGGYVITPPSVINVGAYEYTDDREPVPAPQWLLDLCEDNTPKRRVKKATVNPVSSSGGNRVNPSSITRDVDLTSLAGSLRSVGAEQAQIEEVLLQENQKLVNPLEDKQVLKVAKSVSRYEPSMNLINAVDSDGNDQQMAYSDQKRPFTDAGNAERFVDLKRDELRYVFNLEQWIRWNGICWEPAGTILEDLKQVSRSITLEAASEGDDHHRAALLKHALRSENKDKLSAMRSLAEQTPALQVGAELLDRSKYLLGTPTGVIDLRTGELVASTQDQWGTMQTGVGFDPDAECPRFELFVSEIMDGDFMMITFMQRLLGSLLVGGNNEQILVILHGGGSNGKSVLNEAVKATLGDYAKASGAETFMDSGGQGGAREDILRLRGARAIFTSETKEGDQMDEAVVKSLTGGDSVVARGMYAKQSVEFIPQFTALLSTNHRPIIRGTDDGIWRRLTLVPFLAKFEGSRKDKHLSGKLYAERAGILKWLVDGAVDYVSNGLRRPATVDDAAEEYREDMDTLGGWIGECCVLQSDAATPIGELYENYTAYMRASGLKPVSKIRLGRQFDERGFEKIRKTNTWLRAGIFPLIQYELAEDGKWLLAETDHERDDYPTEEMFK